MNTFELITFLLMIGLGIALANVLYSVSGFWLALLGFVAGALLIPAIIFAHGRYRKWAYMGDKWMPECRCGSATYKYEKLEGKFRLVCQHCRTSYEKRKGEVFVLENDLVIPYKRLVKHRGWI